MYLNGVGRHFPLNKKIRLQDDCVRVFLYILRISYNISPNFPVRVASVTATPSVTNDTYHTVSGDYETFTCTTSPSRPAAWMQWYIGQTNVTGQAFPQQPIQDEDKFISTSILTYTGHDADHGKTLYCEAINIIGEAKVRSTEIQLYVQSTFGIIINSA